MEAEMKRLSRQQIARASNEMYRRIQKRKVTAKDKELLNNLNKLMGGTDLTSQMLKKHKKKRIDKFMYKEI